MCFAPSPQHMGIAPAIRQSSPSRRFAECFPLKSSSSSGFPGYVGLRVTLQVYIDIGAIGADKDGHPPASYGTLLRPTEEGRAGDRVARSARFMGSYKEFKAHCRDLPGLVKAHVALWADAPGPAVYGKACPLRL